MSVAFSQGEKSNEQTKNAKILNRKQIEKRLLGLKSEEYEKIATNLQSQNEKLKQEVKILNEKVQELVHSRKIVKNKNPQIEQEIAKMKNELSLKYESMGYLKGQVKKSNQSDMTEEMKMKIKQHVNTVMQCQKEFKQLQVEREKIKLQIGKNQEDLKEFLPNNEGDAKMDSLKMQNKQLKKQINQIKSGLVTQEKNSKSTISKIYELKDQEKRHLTKSSRQIASSLKEIKQSSLSQIVEISRQIENLKLKKKEVEKDLVTDKIIKESRKSKMEKEIRDSLQFHKELYKKRVKGLNQLNLYENKEKQLKHQIQKQAQISSITYVDVEMQTMKVVAKEFRKDWIGKSQGLTFNDSVLLQYRGETLIKAVTVYKTAEFIVFTKFHYESPQKKKYQTQPPFQKYILKKCQAKKYQSKTQAAMSNLIVSVHTPTKRVVRIEFRWADGDSTVVGWQSEGSTKYPFDIEANERPICMFGSVSAAGKNMYVMQSLGCEINGLQE